MAKKINRQPVVVGTKKSLGNGIVEYVGEQNGWEDYCYYKDEKAFNRHGGVCYVSEEQLSEDNSLVVDPAIINQGCYETYQTIYDAVKEECKDSINKFNDFHGDWQHEFIAYITNQVFETLEGETVENVCTGFDMQEAFDSWLSHISQTTKGVLKSKIYVVVVEEGGDCNIGDSYYSTIESAKKAFAEEKVWVERNVAWVRAGLVDGTLKEDRHTDRMVEYMDDYGNYLCVMIAELDVK